MHPRCRRLLESTNDLKRFRLENANLSLKAFEKVRMAGEALRKTYQGKLRQDAQELWNVLSDLQLLVKKRAMAGPADVVPQAMSLMMLLGSPDPDMREVLKAYQAFLASEEFAIGSSKVAPQFTTP